MLEPGSELREPGASVAVSLAVSLTVSLALFQIVLTLCSLESPTKYTSRERIETASRRRELRYRNGSGTLLLHNLRLFSSM